MSDAVLDGLLGPGSATRIMLADVTTVYAAFPAFVYPVLTAKGGKGVDDHDRIGKVTIREEVRLEDVIGRARDTVDLVLGVVFADEERRQVATSIRELHRFIHGELADETSYHAWEDDLWNWTWAAIMTPLMEAHGQLRGWPSDQFREQAYAGLRAVGELFGADSLPDTYDGFVKYRETDWMNDIDPFAAEATSYLLSQRSDPAPLRGFGQIPHAIVRAVTAPARHIGRIGLLLVNTPAVGEAVRMRPSRGDRIVMTAHRVAWRAVPRFVSRGWIERYMRIRLRFGSPVWRTYYSPRAHSEYRTQVKAARATGAPEPARPSVADPLKGHRPGAALAGSGTPRPRVRAVGCRACAFSSQAAPGSSAPISCAPRWPSVPASTSPSSTP